MIDTSKIAYQDDPKATLANSSDNIVSKFILEEIAPFVALVGQHWTGEQKSEWMYSCILQLENIPLTLLLRAVVSARRRASFPGQFVPMVFGALEGGEAQ